MLASGSSPTKDDRQQNKINSESDTNSEEIDQPTDVLQFQFSVYTTKIQSEITEIRRNRSLRFPEKVSFWSDGPRMFPRDVDHDYNKQLMTLYRIYDSIEQVEIFRFIVTQ